MRNFSHLVMMLGALLISFGSEAQWQEASFKNSRVFTYIPQKESLISTGRALVVNLHGCSQSAEALKMFGHWEKAADLWGAIVTIPDVPGGGVVLGCWDYYGTQQDLKKSHVEFLVRWVEKLKSLSELKIDPNQIYISGLSSGGTQAMVAACLRPDLFAGVGVNAAPAIGTNSNQIGYPATTAGEAKKLCKQWAGGYASHLSTQVASIIYGDNDFIANQKYNRINAEMYQLLTGSKSPVEFDLSVVSGANNKGKGWLWSDSTGPRVSLIENSNLGHNWPSGTGDQVNQFINGVSINYPAYLLEFLTNHNRRM